MNIKNVFTICLLIFVAAAIAVLTVKSLRQNTKSTAASDGSHNDSEDQASDTTDIPIQDGVKVYYFHSNTRCPTCRSIEAYAREAVESGFADQLKRKQIVWQVINYETSGNEHFAADYEVAAPNVVLAMFKAGKQVKWKGLPEVWEHVGDKPAFIDFVQTNLRQFIEEKGVSQ